MFPKSKMILIDKEKRMIELNKEQVAAFYDQERDILFFSDSLKNALGQGENNLYKLELGTNAYLFDKLAGKQNL